MRAVAWLALAAIALVPGRSLPQPPPTAQRRVDPTAELVDTQMTAVALGDAVQLPAVVLYYSTSCPHCWHVAGEFAQLCQGLLGRGIHCAAVAKGTSPMDEVVRYGEHNGLTCPLLVDLSHQYRDALGLEATPVAHLLDTEGQVVAATEPFYRGASLAVERAAAEVQGRGLDDLWRPDTYHGARACSECHTREYASWRLTDHSLATVRLPEASQRDPACLSCHATGSGSDGGYTDKERTGHLRGVGCEACHGPAGGHRPDGSVQPRSTPCETCHDRSHTLSDEPRSMGALLDHHLADGLTAEEIDQRRMDLVTHALPRPGLEVADGLTTGSITCGMCHPAVYDAWEPGPHGPQRADVGCEVCHGPGAPHLAGGYGGGPVLGLRADHDPSCVVQPFCRRCHTPEADPDWQLRPRVAGVHGSPVEPAP